MEQLTLFSKTRQEPEWFLQRRLDAYKQLEKLSLPVIERVKFNRWKLFDKTLESKDQSDERGYGVLPNLDHDKPMIIQYGTRTIFEQLPIELVEQGVILTDLFTAMHDYPELVQKYLNGAVNYNEDKLTAFHQAYMNSGLFLYVPKNVVIDEPIQAILIQDSSVQELFAKHVLIVADSNSQVSYVEKLMTFGTKENSVNIVVEVIALDGAKVKYAAMDRLAQTSVAYVNRRGNIGKDANVDWAIGALNDGNLIADFDSDLVGTGATSHIKVVAISSGKQIQGIDTRVTNYAKHSVGHILQHGVIMDKATLTFNGIGHIIKGAKGADAQQESRVLMLSDSARGDANPILLIDENDVTAGHAASVGQVDEEQLFYLTSRGIPRVQAEKLVIRGFLGTVISAIPLQSVQRELIDVMDSKLGEV
ncbi:MULTISPECIES: Fe-S cluster assembly protein SufD [unclassified Granulicatella]|uniref:Fe-S cluster assembly protein SufD n=1 Tax=unclassified Granulicatella TaxID=2630493 RepID=UPI001D1678BC|nr:MULTISPECIES: Fe-S cluster assembly protein SufD [unclassified Granulicatella]